MAERADSSQDDSDQVIGRKAKHCQPCEKRNRVKTATLFCKDCKTFQCNECSKVHEIFDVMSGHEIVTVEEASSLKPTFDMKGLGKCIDHDKKWKFYCIDERKLCCSTCAIAGHRGCAEVNEISSEAKKQSSKTSEVEFTIQELQEAADNLSKLLEQIQLTTSSKLKAVLDYIDAIKKVVVSKFDQLKVALTEQFQSAKDQLMEQVNTSIATTENISGDLLKKTDLFQSCKTNGTPEQQFIAFNVIQGEIMSFKKKLEGRKSSLHYLDCSIELSQQLTELLKSNISLATYSVDKKPIDNLMSQEEKAVQLKLVTSVNLKQGKQDTGGPFYSGMDFFPDGRLAAVDNENNKLYIMDDNLERKGMFQFSGRRLSVCVVSEEEVAVTSGSVKVIEFLHVSQSNEITLTRTVKTTAKYDSVCLMNETTFLVSTIDDKRPLRMITLTGEEKDFDNLPEKQYKIGDIMSTYIRNKDIAVLTDKLDHAVYMHEVKEKGLPRRVVKHDDIKGPFGVCVGPNDCLFICSWNDNSIVQVSPSGRVVATHKLNINFPCIVCVSKDGRRLAVYTSETENSTLHLFYIHNNYI